MKGLIISFIILFVFQDICPQIKDEINCVGNRSLSFELVSDIETAFKDFVQTDAGGKNEKFILIDLVKKNEFNEIYLFSTRYIFEIMFKRPDCYFKCNDRIVYLYTEDYIHVNDSNWLKNVLTDTRQILGVPDFKVSWANDSVIGPIKDTGDFSKITPIYHYDPIPLKYIIKNGKIYSKEIVSKLYYPDNRRPKGIPIIRTFPYWSLDKKAYP